jgi:hypothetical protein
VLAAAEQAKINVVHTLEIAKNTMSAEIGIPQTMMEFFLKSTGTWFTQRTVHHFTAAAKDQSGESNLSVEVLGAKDPRILEICATQGIAADRAQGGASFLWQDNQDKNPPNPEQAAILVDVPNDEGGRSGRLFRNQGYVEKIPVVSRYWFGQDGILTINTDYDNNQGQERCWFVTDYFRVRVSTVRSTNGVYMMTYCSERKCIDNAELEAMVAHNLTRNL